MNTTTYEYEKSLDNLYRTLRDPNYGNVKYVAGLYKKARITKGHHQYKSLCTQYGVSLQNLEVFYNS